MAIQAIAAVHHGERNGRPLGCTQSGGPRSARMPEIDMMRHADGPSHAWKARAAMNVTGNPSEIKPDRLLLSRRLGEIRTKPFCFFHIDNYLPDALYESLRESFPDESTYDSDGSGKLGFRSSDEPDDFERFCAQNPDWQRLLDFFRSDEFVLDAGRTMAPSLIAARDWKARRRWHNYSEGEIPASRLSYLLEEPVRTTFQISQLPNGAEVIPHTDAPRKLISLMLYFRDEDWEEASGGATVFFEPRDAERARQWSPTERIPFSELNEIGSCGFARNRLAGFVRSENSFHGVHPIVSPAGQTRRALLVNIKRLKWSKRDVL